MLLERDHESIAIPGLENPKEIKEIMELGSAVARKGTVHTSRRHETSTVIGAFGGSKYRVVYENFAAYDPHESLDVTGEDMGVTIVRGGLWMTEAFTDYYFGQRNIRDVLSGLDPITKSPASEEIGVDHEKADNSDSSRIVAVGSNGFYTTKGSTLFVVAKTMDDARRVYASLLEQDNNFSALRVAFSKPNSLPFIYLTPEQYENMTPTLTPEEIKTHMDKMIDEMLGYLFPDDDSS